LSVGASLRGATRDFYQQSWRLLVLNSAFSAFVLSVVGIGLWVTPVFVLLLLAGPFAAALMHCAVTLVQTDELRLGDAVTGIRLHWRRGFVLGLLFFAAAAAAGVAVPFYAGIGGWSWALALVALYAALVFGVLQLLLWPLAVFELDRPLAEVVRASLVGFLRRPAAGSALALALLTINLLGLAAGLVPFLTLTIAYSFLAAARFALPRSEPGGTTVWPA
jgi:hypothetical protein